MSEVVEQIVIVGGGSAGWLAAGWLRPTDVVASLSNFRALIERRNRA